MPIEEHKADLETLIAAIARSPIIVAALPLRPSLPAGFDEVDVVILEWIASEARRMSRSVLPI